MKHESAVNNLHDLKVFVQHVKGKADKKKDFVYTLTKLSSPLFRKRYIRHVQNLAVNVCAFVSSI